jgi:hypothetical protein
MLPHVSVTRGKIKIITSSTIELPCVDKHFTNNSSSASNSNIKRKETYLCQTNAPVRKLVGNQPSRVSRSWRACLFATGLLPSWLSSPNDAKTGSRLDKPHRMYHPTGIKLQTIATPFHNDRLCIVGQHCTSSLSGSVPYRPSRVPPSHVATRTLCR